MSIAKNPQWVYSILAFFIKSFVLITTLAQENSTESFIPAPQKAVFEILNSKTYNKDVRPGLVEEGGSHNATPIQVNIFFRKMDKVDDLRVNIIFQNYLQKFILSMN